MTSNHKLNLWIYWISFVAILIGIGLTLISWLGLCSSACAEAHKFHLLGLPFEIVGLIFFGILGISHLLSFWYSPFALMSGLMIFGALGAEMMFVIIQKTVIGSWCPVCLGIASAVLVLVILYTTGYAINLFELNKKDQREAIMENIWKGMSSLSMIFLGLFIAFVGITTHDELEAAQNTIKDQLAFGNLDSPIEVYLFTDWVCPACKKIEPSVERMAPRIMKEARLIFVDYAIHPETMNFIPYNLSFILKNKQKYFELRRILTDLSKKTRSPSEDEVERAIALIGEKYHELNYSDVALATRYYNTLAKQFGIDGTPTMVIINTETKKGKKLIGKDEITELKVLRAIYSLE